MNGIGGALSLQLEDDHSGIVTGGEEIERWMSCENPESFVLAAECVEALALCHVPDANRFVLAVGDDELLTWVEQHA